MVCNLAIIGAGPAGCMSAYSALHFGNCEITIFDYQKPLKTLLYTGGGRCNLAHAEYDFKELAKFYPRGEKFLYSVFSSFNTFDTIDFFNSIGVETYVQSDDRIFPVSNSAKDVREKFLNKLKGCKFKKEKVESIDLKDEKFVINNNPNYIFDKVIIAVGGHSGFNLAKSLGHSIVTPRPALSGLVTSENFSELSGISLKNIPAKVFFDNELVTQANGDFLFTHTGVSGPLMYKISSDCAMLDYSMLKPLRVEMIFVDIESDFQQILDKNSKKDIKNLLSDFIPKALVDFMLNKVGIDPSLKCFQVNSKTRKLIENSIFRPSIEIVGTSKDGEIVTAGGVNLDEINPKTMQSKIVNNLAFCGEVINVDGYCGGFNLQNCWSTGYLAGKLMS